MEARKKCLFTREDGSSCKAFALPASDYCFFHDPARAEERKQARKKGGQARSKPVLLNIEKEETRLDTVFNVTQALGTAYRAVASGKMDVRIANCLGFLGGHILRGLHECKLATQMEFLDCEILKLKELLKKEGKEIDSFPPALLTAMGLPPDQSRTDGAESETVVQPETTEALDGQDTGPPADKPPPDDTGNGDDIQPLFG